MPFVNSPDSYWKGVYQLQPSPEKIRNSPGSLKGYVLSSGCRYPGTMHSLYLYTGSFLIDFRRFFSWFRFRNDRSFVIIRDSPMLSLFGVPNHILIFLTFLDLVRFGVRALSAELFVSLSLAFFLLVLSVFI